MPCDRCHQGVEQSAVAGLPPVSFCVRCHTRFIPDHPEIVKLVELYEAGEPIRWRKVNVMPTEAAVHFHHAVHVRAEVACETCHGDVANMTLAVRVIDTADMGWCLECHEAEGATTDCVACHH